MFGWRGNSHPDPVQPGQAFRVAARSHRGTRSVLIWEVERVYTGPDGIRHAHLFCQTDPKLTKVLALSALLDPILYEQIR